MHEAAAAPQDLSSATGSIVIIDFAALTRDLSLLAYYC